jgi:hypothetical protein
LKLPTWASTTHEPGGETRLRKISLKYRGKCVKCGSWIAVGETAYWEQGKGVWHLDCGAPTRSRPRKLQVHGSWIVARIIVAIVLILALYVASKSMCPHGGQYYPSICTRLCGCQYNVCVSYDYNCANDYSAIPGFPVESIVAGLFLGVALILSKNLLQSTRVS